MTAPAFTVILSAYNEERLVAEAIRSVLAQTRGDFELVVVDDGSADGTADAVREFLGDPRLRLIEQPNRGLAASLNTAAAAGAAPRIALIDADDLWFPEFLERMGAALDSTPGAGFAYTDAWWLREATGRFFRQSVSEYNGAPKHPAEGPEALLVSLLPENWIFGLTVIERGPFEAVGGFDESLAACEDYELWLRLLAAGYGAARAPGRLAVQRERADSMSRDLPAMLRNLKAVYRIVAEDLDVSDETRGLARDQMATMDRYLDAASSKASPLSVWWATRGRLGRLRNRLAPAAVWHEGVPAEVREALPEVDLSRPVAAD